MASYIFIDIMAIGVSALLDSISSMETSPDYRANASR